MMNRIKTALSRKKDMANIGSKDVTLLEVKERWQVIIMKCYRTNSPKDMMQSDEMGAEGSSNPDVIINVGVVRWPGLHMS